MSFRIRLVLAAAAASCGMASMAQGINYTSGNLVLSQVGPGTGTTGNLVSAATAVRLREFGLSTATSGAFVANDLSLPSGLGDPTRLTISGSAAEGFLTRSADGRYLTIMGYDAANAQNGPLANSSIATSTNHSAAAGTPVNRVVGRVDFSQGTSLYRMTDAFNAANVRSVASVDGSTFITAGTGGSSSPANTGGLRFFDPGAGTGSSQLFASPATMRVANYAYNDNRLFFSTQSATAGITGIWEVNAGVPTILPGFAAQTGLSPYDFWFADDDTLFVADDGSVAAASKGGLQRWELVAGTWTLAYRVTTGLTSGLRSLCGMTDPTGNFIMYATTAETSTRLVAITDDANAGLAGANATLTGLETAASGFAFRGVDFAPVPAPGAGTLLALGGLMAARRRR